MCRKGKTNKKQWEIAESAEIARNIFLSPSSLSYSSFRIFDIREFLCQAQFRWIKGEGSQLSILNQRPKDLRYAAGIQVDYFYPPILQNVYLWLIWILHSIKVSLKLASAHFRYNSVFQGVWLMQIFAKNIAFTLNALWVIHFEAISIVTSLKMNAKCLTLGMTPPKTVFRR